MSKNDNKICCIGNTIVICLTSTFLVALEGTITYHNKQQTTSSMPIEFDFPSRKSVRLVLCVIVATSNKSNLSLE